jgi:hypothetical protein
MLCKCEFKPFFSFKFYVSTGVLKAGMHLAKLCRSGSETQLFFLAQNIFILHYGTRYLFDMISFPSPFSRSFNSFFISRVLDAQIVFCFVVPCHFAVGFLILHFQRTPPRGGKRRDTASTRRPQ